MIELILLNLCMHRKVKAFRKKCIIFAFFSLNYTFKLYNIS